LVSRAARVVDPQDFFTEYFGGVGLEPDQGAVVANEVERLLVKVGLSVPAEQADPIEILSLHCGVTGREVAAVLTAVETGSEEFPAMFDTVRRLAPQWADALLGGVRELCDFAQSHPTSWPDRERETTLPAMVDELFVAELRERPVGTEDRENSVGVALRELRPRLILDAERRKVCLR